jgi:sulfoxide reductase heme-binding subunit YedZ
MIQYLRGFGPARIRTHLALAALTLGSAYAAHLYVPYAEPAYFLTIGMGYLSLALIGVTLVIGPLNLLWRRHNPVNIDLRRDVGIWAGLTGCLHVVCGFQIHMQGQVLLYFLQPRVNGGYRLLTNPFGLANDVGLIATILLILLLVISNDLSLRRLKGRRWKTLQRYNYLLFALAALHTFVYQTISHRDRFFTALALAVTALTLLAQLIGITLYRLRRSSRQARRVEHGAA